MAGSCSDYESANRSKAGFVASEVDRFGRLTNRFDRPAEALVVDYPLIPLACSTSREALAVVYSFYAKALKDWVKIHTKLLLS